MALNRKQIENDLKNCLNAFKNLEGKIATLNRHARGLANYKDIVKMGKDLKESAEMLKNMELIDAKTKEPLK